MPHPHPTARMSRTPSAAVRSRLRPHRRLPRHAPAAMHAPSVNIGSCALWARRAGHRHAVRRRTGHRRAGRRKYQNLLAQKPKTLQNRTLCERARWPAKVGILPPWKLKNEDPAKTTYSISDFFSREPAFTVVVPDCSGLFRTVHPRNSVPERSEHPPKTVPEHLAYPRPIVSGGSMGMPA